MYESNLISNDELRTMQLKILNQVHMFCEEYNIEYFISYGTLLGAVRHKGYIPWDDDIDICMTRPNYDRFVKEFNLSNELYRCISYDIDPSFPYTFSKIIDTRTTLIEKTDIKYDLGVNIDLFPIDGINNDQKLLRRQILLRKLADVKITSISKRRLLMKNLILMIGKGMLIWLPTEVIIRKIIMNSKAYEYETAESVCRVSFGSKIDKPFPKDYISEYTLLEFEGEFYHAPGNYDGYLRSVYGEYMRLPPESERKSHHNFFASWRTTK